MSEETGSNSGLSSVTRNMGHYSGVAFGAGYLITLLGTLAVFAEILLRWTEAFRYVSIPTWLGVTLFFVFLAIVCGIYLGGRSLRVLGQLEISVR